MQRKTIIIAAGVLLAAAAATAVAVAQGHRGWRGEGGDGYGMGPGMGPGMGGIEDGGRHGRDDMHGRWWRGGSLTQSEHEARSRERFARIDRNSDGVLDAAEIEASLAERGQRWRGRGGGEALGGQRMLRRFDENRDGKVTREEFASTTRRLFAEMDLTGDNRIDDADLPPMLRGRNLLAEGGSRGFGRGGRMLDVLRSADANKDGVITQEEALAEAGRMFARLDRSNDGIIEQADFDAMRKEMVDYRVRRFIHHFGGSRDGKVTREQFDKVAKERFAMRDLNNDGSISRDEMGGRGWFRGRGHGGDGHPGDERGRGPGGSWGGGQGAGPGGAGRN